MHFVDEPAIVPVTFGKPLYRAIEICTCGSALIEIRSTTELVIRLTEKGGAHKLAEDNLAGSGKKLFEESVGRFEK